MALTSAFALPRKVRLETSSRCQLKCPACPTATKAIDEAVGGGVLKFSDFRQFVLTNPKVEVIEISNYGEVFLNPELPAILRFAHEQGVVVRMVNGVNLNHATEEVLEALVQYGVEAISCSIDGASQETYSQYRVRGNFERVIGHIRRINHYKAVHRSKFPLLRWQFIVFGHNEHEIPAVKAMAKELGMTTYFKLSWDSDFSPIRDVAEVRRQLGIAAVTREDYAQKTGRDYAQGICRQLWDEPQINWDGRNLGCCRNFWGDFGGNVFQDGFAAVFNHEKMDYARQMLQGRQKPRKDVPCSTCDIYQRMRKNQTWFSPKLGEPPLWRILGRKVKNEIGFRRGKMQRRGRRAMPTAGHPPETK